MSSEEKAAAGQYFAISNHTLNADHFSVPDFELTNFQNWWKRII